MKFLARFPRNYTNFNWECGKIQVFITFSKFPRFFFQFYEIFLEIHDFISIFQQFPGIKGKFIRNDHFPHLPTEKEAAIINFPLDYKITLKMIVTSFLIISFCSTFVSNKKLIKSIPKIRVQQVSKTKLSDQVIEIKLTHIQIKYFVFNFSDFYKQFNKNVDLNNVKERKKEKRISLKQEQIK